jgi:hypothetical protein
MLFDTEDDDDNDDDNGHHDNSKGIATYSHRRGVVPLKKQCIAKALLLRVSGGCSSHMLFSF